MSIYRSLSVCLSFKSLMEVPKASEAEGAPRADSLVPPLCPALDAGQALAQGTAALSISYLHSIKLAFQRLSSEIPL